MILTLLPKRRVTIEGFFFDTLANIFAKILFVFVSDKSDHYFFNMSVTRSYECGIRDTFGVCLARYTSN